MTDTPPSSPSPDPVDPVPGDPTPPVVLPPADPGGGSGGGSPQPTEDPVAKLQAVKDGLAVLAADLSNLNMAVGLIIQHMQSTGAGNVVDPADLAALHASLDAAATDASNLNNLVNGTPTGSPVPPTGGGGTDLPPGDSGGPVDGGPTEPPAPAPEPTPTPEPVPEPPAPVGKLSAEDRARIAADEATIDTAQADIDSTLGP